MSDLEDRIRRELTAVAALARPDTVRPLRAPTPGRGPRASRWLAPVAAMVAVAVVAAVTVVGRDITRGPASAAPPAGRPDIYVTVTGRYLQAASANSCAGHGPNCKPSGTVGRLVNPEVVLTATVHDASTGAALASVQVSPSQPEHPRGPAASWLAAPTQIAAAADDRTFAISYLNGVYLLHVDTSGRAARLVKLSMTIPFDTSSSIALSPDATKLAVNVNECAGNKPCVDGIEIITLATGTTRTWLGSSASEILNPLWTDNGTAVMFEWGSGRLPGNGYWILSDAAPLGNLLAESVRVPYPPAQPNPPTAILTPDGRTLLIMTQRIVPTSGSSGNWVFRITDVDPGTGRLLRVLATFEQPYKGNPYAADAQCNILSLAPTGLHALVACPRFGRLDGSTFTPLPAVVPPDVALASAISVAW